MQLINGSGIRLVFFLIFFVLLFCSNGPGQGNFLAIPADDASKYRLDFARNFFNSPEAEKNERAELYRSLKDLENLQGRVAGSAANLLLALRLNDAVQIRFMRHYAYLYLRYAVNTKDETSNTEASALSAEINKRTAFLNRELILINDRELAAFARQKPLLKNYLFAIENARRYRPYTLSLKEEELLNTIAPAIDEWQPDLYDRLLQRNQSNLAAAVNGTGTPPPASAATTSKTTGVDGEDVERAKRSAGFKKYYAGFASQRELYAFTLMRIAAAQTQTARLRHFEDAASQFYFDRYWTNAEVSRLLEQIAEKAGIRKNYEQIRIDYVKRIGGYREADIWDLPLASKNVRVPRFTIGEAAQIIEKALAPLGPEYGQELARLLDPANGRMDIVPGQNRRNGGFSQGYIGTGSVFFSGGFRGFYNDVRVLAHESTHAVHRQLMNNNKILPDYAEGPHYLFEAFAILNEFLLPDYLYAHETDPVLKRYYLEQFLEGKGMEIFVVAPEAMLEQKVYEGVANGNIKNADDLDALTKKIYSRFSIFPEKTPELKNEWMRVTLMFEDPFYDINYVYGALLALKFYEMYRRDPQYFVPRYTALLKNGFNAPPEVLLKRFLDIDISDPQQLLPGALKIIEEKVNLLEKSYKE